jgi:hypothetical protein
MSEHSTYEDRNTDLFFDIADVLEFFPERYNQRTWGEFIIGQTPERRAMQDRLMVANPVRYNTYSNDEETQRQTAAFRVQFGYDVEGNAEDVNWIHADEGCGSALCVAGHAAALRGWLPTVYANSSGSTVSWNSVSKVKGQDINADGSREVSEVAEELLGINHREARHLFDSDHVWTADDLRNFGKGERILTHVDED